MATIYCPDEDTLFDILRKVRESADTDITLEIGEGSVFWQNDANEEAVKELAQRIGKKLTLTPTEQAIPDKKSEGIAASPQHVTVPVTQKAEASEEKAAVVPVKTTAPKRFPALRKLFTFPQVLIVVLLLMILVGGSTFAFAFYYLPQAEVTLLVSKKTLQRDVEVSLVPEQTQVDTTSRSIPATVKTAEVEETGTFDATGTKTIGEKAKGTLTIYNWTTATVSLPVGQIFTVNANQEGAGLTFVSTQTVDVPPLESSSEDLNQTLYTAGTATIAVEASDSGTLFNLSSGLAFTVQGRSYGTSPTNPGMRGLNAQSFTGGSTQEITVVSQADIDQAITSLNAGLVTKAREQLQQQNTTGEKLLEDHITTQTLYNNVSRDIDDEAREFTVTTKVRASGFVYSQGDLENLLLALMEQNVPDGFTLAGGEHVITVSFLDQTEQGVARVRATVEALLIPDVDIDALAQQLTGKKPQEAEEIIKNIEHVTQGSVLIRPSFPQSLQRLPHRSDRITITIREE